jgi:hypothetical protein
MQKHTPYDTGKVKIGLLYTPPPPPSTPESDWIQGVLLGDRGGLSDVERSTIQSLVAIAIVVIGIFLLGGITNA